MFQKVDYSICPDPNRINYFEVLMIVYEIAELMAEEKKKLFLKYMDEVMPRCQTENEIQDRIHEFLCRNGASQWAVSITKPGVRL
jgi:hypothetical protein